MGKNGSSVPNANVGQLVKKKVFISLVSGAKDHIDGHGQQSTVTGTITSETSVNLSNHVLNPSVGVPSRPPEVTAT